MSIELKIKTKHLSVEAKIIRFEENKLARQITWAKDKGKDWSVNHGKKLSIALHRRNELRSEQRAAYLARAYLAGMEYKSIEAKRKPEREYHFKHTILPRALKLVNKYGKPLATITQLEGWAGV